jgi:hypothetical protein
VSRKKTKPTDTQVSPTTIGWAAGIIDGEGCISMTRCYVGTARRVTESYQIRLRVRMTHYATVRKLQKIFGGTFSKHPSSTPRAKCTYLWQCGDLLTIEVLTIVLPALLTRRKQALLVMEYRQRCYGVQSTWPNGRCPPKLVRLRHHFFMRLATLNKKGPPR